MTAIIGLIAIAFTPAQDPDDIAAIDRYCKQQDAFATRNKPSVYADLGWGWKRFKTLGEVEEAKMEPSSSYERGSTWPAKSKSVRRTDHELWSPSGDWHLTVSYYFRPDGTLAKSACDYRTFLGDIAVDRQKWFSSKGALLKKTIVYRDLTSDKVIKKKEFMNMNEPAYMTVRSLPYYKLLGK